LLLPNPYGDLKMDSEDRSTQKDTSSSAVTSSLSDLIARLEKATGPDDALDFEIAMACNIDIRRCCGQGRPVSSDGITITGEECCDDPSWVPDQYTASLDAAMTLVPKGMEKDFTDLYGVARVSVGINAEPGPFYGTHEGGSLAIALCIAALKASSLPQIESLPADDSEETRLEI